MADATVGVLQATSPDRQVDNLAVTNDVGTAVVRQKVDVNGSLLEELLTEMRVLVANLGGMFPDVAGRTRVSLDAINGTAATAGANLGVSVNAGTLPTVTTVATVTNVAQEGGVAANTNVTSLIQAAANVLRQQIVVS